jgi:DNA-binding Lrp family transcriptional regulator
MDKALVLLTLEPETGSTPIEKVRKISGVLEADLLYGPYDAYALIEGLNSGILQGIIIEKMRQVDGIRSTLTCFVAK